MTVNDFHQQPEAFAPRRAWLADIYAPHVNFVARMSTPGGRGADWGDTNTTKWVATAESARREVQALQPYRPDYIKADRKSVVSGKSVSVRVDLGGRRILKTKPKNTKTTHHKTPRVR